MKLIFLDIDGVLNNSTVRCPRIDPECVARINKILDAHPDARIVISSNWRFMIGKDWMSLEGFDFLMQSHGLNGYGRIYGMTPPSIPDRSKAILAWVANLANRHNWIALDDEVLDLGEHQHRAYHVNGRFGISDSAVAWAIRKLAEGGE